MESSEARELTRALEALNSNISELTRDLHTFSSGIVAMNPEAAGRAMGDFRDQIELTSDGLKDSVEMQKKDLKAEREAAGIQKDANQQLTEWLKQLRAIKENNESELRLRTQMLTLNKEEIELMKKQIESRNMEEQQKLRKNIEDAGFKVPEDKEKGILGELKDHFIKSDMSMKGLAISGGVMAISMALDAIKSLWSGIKDEVTNMNKAIRSNQAGVLGSVSGVGTGEFQSGQLKLAQNMAERDKFLIAAGVSVEQFTDAMITNARRLGESMNQAGAMRDSIAEMALHARSAGLALKEYQDTVVDLTRTNSMDITQKQKAMEIADAVYATERRMNLEKGFLINNIKSTYQSLSQMGYGIENVVGLNIRFADAIKAGRMSLSDIIDYAKGMKDASEGQFLFFGQLLKEYGGAKGQKIEARTAELAGNDPKVYAYLLGALAKGAPSKVLGDYGYSQDAAGAAQAAADMRALHDVTASGFYKGNIQKGGASRYGAEAFMPDIYAMTGAKIGSTPYAQSELLGIAGGKPLPEADKAGQNLDAIKESTSKLTTMAEDLGVIRSHIIDFFAERTYGMSAVDMSKAAMSGDYQSMVNQYQTGLRGGASATDMNTTVSGILAKMNVDQLKKLGGAAGGGHTFNLIGDPEVMRRILRDYVGTEASAGWREKNIKIDEYNDRMKKADEAAMGVPINIGG